MTKEKKVVRYRQSTFTFCGKKTTNRYKHTLLATITGAEARALLEHHRRDRELFWHPVSDSKLEIYDDELLPDKPKRKKAKTS